jgi:hypothetical protein
MENITIAKRPITVVIGSKLFKKVPAKGTFNNAKPDKIQATIKRINLSILFPSFQSILCTTERYVVTRINLDEKCVFIRDITLCPPATEIKRVKKMFF